LPERYIASAKHDAVERHVIVAPKAKSFLAAKGWMLIRIISYNYYSNTRASRTGTARNPFDPKSEDATMAASDKGAVGEQRRDRPGRHRRLDAVEHYSTSSLFFDPERQLTQQ